jgi:DNA repair protein RadC
MTLHNLPLHERPRERLLNLGVESLSLVELLAILLSTGTKGKSVIYLAHEIVAKFGSFEGLLAASITELCEVKGVGKAKAVVLKAAFGIALKKSSLNAKVNEKVSTLRAYELIKEDLSNRKQEVIVVILKDVKERLIAIETVAMGTLSDVLAHPREIFYPAVRHKAHSFILAHNHPSGDPLPSQADLNLTRHLLRSSQVMGIVLEDHLIIGKDRFVSLKELGYFPY